MRGLCQLEGVEGSSPSPVLLRRGGFGRPPAGGLFEPVAFAVHLEDMNVMGEPVEQRTGVADAILDRIIHI